MKEERKSIIQSFIENYRITYLLMVSLFVFGFLAVLQMPKESAPEVDIPVVVVTTVLPGAGAENVEELITRPVENQMAGLSDVSTLSSSSQQGFSMVVVQFDPRADGTEMIAEVRNRANKAKVNFPSGAGEPVVQKISFSDVPIMRIVVAGSFELTELKVYAERIKEELESVKDVSQVSVVGDPERQVKIKLNSSRMRELSISPAMVVGALSQANIDLPVGVIETGGGIYAVRFDSKLLSAEDVRQVPVIEREGAVIKIGDLGEVEDGVAPLSNVTRFSIDGSEPEATISLQIFKESGRGDILTISDTSKEKIDDLLNDVFPAGLKVEVIQNDADIIRTDLSTLISSGILTIIIIILIMALFLGWRESFLASLVVPFSFLSAFIIINILGLTINFLTLFSLILSLGILVDASVVITEGMFQKRLIGMSGKESAVETVKEFQSPLIAGTMTTVFVFAPMLLVSGIMGEFIKSIPITVSAVLLSALFVALVIITTVATRFLGRELSEKKKTGLLGFGDFLDKTATWYQKNLSKITSHKPFSYGFLIFITGLFFIAVSFPFIGVVSINMFPLPDSDTIFIDLKAKAGTPFDDTNELVKPIEKALCGDPDVKSFLTTVGQSSSAGSIDIAQAGESNKASFIATLSDDRSSSSDEVVNYYRELFKNYNGAEISVGQPEAGPGEGTPIRINLKGDNLNDLEQTAVLLSGVLASVEGTENVDSGVQLTTGEFVIDINKTVAKQYGLTAVDVADYIRTMITGKEASSIKVLEDEIEVKIYSADYYNSNDIGIALPIDVSEIREMSIQTPKGAVSLGTFIDISLKPGRSVIERLDSERNIAVTSAVVSGYNSQEIISAFQEKLKEVELPKGVEVSYGGETEDIQESFADLGEAMLIGVFMIFILMVIQLKSYRQPFFIIVTIPLAVTGVFLGLALVGQPLSFPAFIGIVALSGVVVNNAIILIDTINKRRDSGEENGKAVVLGASSRFRPVILTTATTVFGLLPLVFASPEWSPVAYSIIFGLLFSTVLTLVVVPILCYRFPKR
ncbi:MAG: efflux RND transporter permease subunit [Candidatus Pacebacteria bacterium]|nr:efflux RND transporter permease subunit [Candidatus Paceibacterota bacterium]